MTSRNDLDNARKFLDQAAELWEAGGDNLDMIRAAAQIGFGYSQLAHIERTAGWRVEDLARNEARWAEDVERVDRRYEEQRQYEERVAAAQEAPMQTVEDHMAALKKQLGYDRAKEA